MPSSVKAGESRSLPFFINATDLAAGTVQYLVAPVDGYIEAVYAVVQTAIVTGGAITCNNKDGAVGGLSVTVADAAVVGTVASDEPSNGGANRFVGKGEKLSVTPSAAFTGGGAVNGFVLLRATQDPQNQMPY